METEGCHLYIKEEAILQSVFSRYPWLWYSCPLFWHMKSGQELATLYSVVMWLSNWLVYIYRGVLMYLGTHPIYLR